MELYKKISHLHETLKDWWDDKEIFHYLGLLFAQKRDKKHFDFYKIWSNWNNESNSREEFKKYLLNEIKLEIFGTQNINDFFSESKDWYVDNNRKLVQILLLLDIVEGNKGFKDKLPSCAFHKDGNDIEHIYPQTPEEIETPEQIRKAKEFLLFLQKNDDENKIKDDLLINRFDNEKDDPNYINELKIFLHEYTKNINTQSIGNLVLLYASLNRSIGNKPYFDKRRRILEYFNAGNYIQPHTLKVFARYYLHKGSTLMDIEYWRQDDIIANEEAIKKTLIKFFEKISNEDKK